jgi:Tfp pilus assembly protein PilV
MEHHVNSENARNNNVGAMTLEGQRASPGGSLFSGSGASLIEITLTVMIVALIAIVIATFSRNTMNMSVDARAMDAAHLAGEQKLVELSAETFSETTGKDTTYTDNVRCIRSWSLKDTCYIKRGIVTVEYKTQIGTKQILLTGAIP